MRVADGARFDYGVDLGGFIVKDRLWFFAAYNRVDFRGDLSRVESSTYVSSEDLFPFDSTEDLYSGKLTWNAAPSTTVVGTVFADPSATSGAAGADPRQGAVFVTPPVSTGPVDVVFRPGPGGHRLRHPGEPALRIGGPRHASGLVPPGPERAHGPGRHPVRGLDVRAAARRMSNVRLRPSPTPSPADTVGSTVFRIAASPAVSSTGETSRSTKEITRSRSAADYSEGRTQTHRVLDRGTRRQTLERVRAALLRARIRCGQPGRSDTRAAAHSESQGSGLWRLPSGLVEGRARPHDQRRRAGGTARTP